MRILLLAALLLGAGAARAATCETTTPLDLAAHADAVGTRTVAFVASDLAGRCWSTGTDAVARRRTPFSTFKIPHLLIALETGAADGLEQAIAWSPQRHPAQPYWPGDWAREQTLASAFERSTAWYFKELVPRVGAARYRAWLRRFAYGNQAFAAAADGFWLDGTLAVSPLEQVAFLGCVASYGCGLSRRSVDALEAVALEREAPGLRLYGKTGSGPLGDDFDGPFGGWFVGYVRDREGRPVAAFALYAEGESFAALRTFRREFALRMLAAAGLWPGT